jgi:hypothetical protein
MSLAEDLLQQAKALCELDSYRPKQANLRRSVSSAYYALFHALVAAGVESMVPARSELRHLVARKFQHGTMKATAERAGQAERQKRNERKKDPAAPADNSDLLQLASAFVSLQEARHLADYAPDEVLTKLQARTHIEDAAQAMRALEKIRATPAAERLLWEMLLGKLER